MLLAYENVMAIAEMVISKPEVKIETKSPNLS